MPPAVSSTDPFHARLARIERERPPQDLVENRVTFGSEGAEFAVYDTVRPAERVPLSASNPLYCGMVTGEKLIHTVTGTAIPFFPAESLVVPSGQRIEIDFPGASDERPTKCLTIEIDRSKVGRVVQTLNEKAPRHAESGDWVYEDEQVCHFHNTPGFERTIQCDFGFSVLAPEPDDIQPGLFFHPESGRIPRFLLGGRPAVRDDFAGARGAGRDHAAGAHAE